MRDVCGWTITYPARPATVVKLGVTYPFTYATVHARLGYEARDGAWKVMLWGKNIFNEYYGTAVSPGSGSASRLAARPDTYGIALASNSDEH